jgi:hypothetical protein
MRKKHLLDLVDYRRGVSRAQELLFEMLGVYMKQESGMTDYGDNEEQCRYSSFEDMS